MQRENQLLALSPVSSDFYKKKGDAEDFDFCKVLSFDDLSAHPEDS